MFDLRRNWLEQESAKWKCTAARCRDKRSHTSWTGAVSWEKGECSPQGGEGFVSFPVAMDPGTNDRAGKRPELGAEEKILAGEQLKSPELQPLVCLIEARGQGLLRSAREGDELRTGTNMRAILSALASGRAEIERLGKRQGWLSKQRKVP